jgi:hypothetical protein
MRDNELKFMGLGRVELPTSRLSGAVSQYVKSGAGPVFIGQEPLSPADDGCDAEGPLGRAELEPRRWICRRGYH